MHGPDVQCRVQPWPWAETLCGISTSATRLYLKHVCVFVMAVLHHHSLVPGQCVGDAVLAFTVHRLKKKTKQRYIRQFEHKKQKSFDVWFCFSKQLMWYLHRFTVTNCSTHEYYRWISADVTSKMERKTTCMVLMKWEVLHRKIHKKTVLNYQVTRM